MFHWNTWNVDQDDKRCDKNQIQNFRTGETRGRSESITEGALYWNARDQNTTRRKRNQIKNIYIMEFIIENWASLLIGLLAFLKVVVNITPTEKDNQIFGYLDVLITAITGDRRKKK